jgi:hypothetical protein
MRTLFCLLLSAIFFYFNVTTVNAQVSGTVYLDINNNGARTVATAPFEPGVFGVIVRAFNTAGVQVGTTTTDASGAYSLPGVTTFPVRLEFATPTNQFSGKRPTANSSNVQFIAATTTTADYAVGYNTMFSNNANPWTATNAAINGDAIAGGSSGLARNLFVQEYTFDNTPVADGANYDNRWLGSVFGLTYQRETRTLMMAAYLKRHIGFGPGGIDAIYRTNIDASGVATQPTIMLELANIGINVGTDPRTGGANPIAADSLTPNQDLGVFGQVGKRGIGNIDLAENGSDLYVTNLFENKVHRINIGMPVKSSFTATDVTGTWTITGPTLGGSEEWHIMGVKYYQGKIYVGGIRSRQRTDAPVASQADLDADHVNLTGHVYELDPVTGTQTEVLQFPFNYRRGYSNSDRRYQFKNNWWRAWQNNGDADVLRNDFNDAEEIFPQPSAPFNTGNNTGIYYPQPMLSDIEFDVDGSMIVGVRDRFGDQSGFNNYLEGVNGQTAIADGRLFRGLNSGEVLRAGKIASTWSMESNAQVTTNGVLTNTNAANAQSNGVAGNPPASSLALTGSWNPSTGQPYGWSTTQGFGPGGRYYYYNHASSSANVPVGNIFDGSVSVLASHYLKSNAGFALFAGYDELIHTAMDPDGIAFASGLLRFSNKGQATGTNAGNMTDQMQLVKAPGTTILSGPAYPGTMGKSNAMGDIELLQEAMPIEIGNRIWSDLNGNGIQDANETGIGSVTVILRSPGANGTFGDGDDQTWTTTTDANGNYYFDNTAAGGNVNDTRATTLGYTGLPTGNTGILNSQNYRIEIDPSQANLTNYRITTADVNGVTGDNIDNDGTQSNLTGVGTRVSAIVNTSNNDYNFDFGFKQLGAIGDKVWLDNGTGTGGVANDGLQNGNEPGVSGVTVELFLNGTRIASTVTDAYGNYLFENLQTGGANVYTVKVTPPANYSFTTQTNTSADLGNDATGSDINPLTGTSYNITLAIGETERDIDAGLVFNTVTTLPSIGDRVWLDNGQGGGTANDGIQNGTEAGVAGVTVTLFRDINGDGDVNDPNEIIGTTVTDGNGNYLFTNVPPAANYQVGFSLPPTFTFSPKDAGGNDLTDSDVNTSGANFGKTDFFAVAADNLTIDAGINNSTAATTSSLGDKVWNDINRDGIQDANEPGIQGVLVTLLQNGTPVATTRTDAFGNFEFTNLAPGTGYELVFTQPTGYTTTAQDAGSGLGQNSFDSDINTGTGSTGTFALLAGQRGDYDAGYYNNTTGLNSLGNFVWNDLDGDGVQDANEPGVAGVSVLIRTSTGGQVDNPARAGTQDYVVTTDENGFYRFADLPNGDYVVIFSNLPAGYTFTTAVGAGDNGTNTNSDATAASGTTAIYNLTGGEYDQTVDAGLVRGTSAGGPSIGNRVWYDLDNDGIQDAPSAGVAPELGVAGVTVTLNSPGPNGIIGDGDDILAISTTTTDALGNYLFTSGNVPGGLTAGIPYYLRFTGLPTGYNFSTPQNAGSNDETDSDIANTGTGTTGLYILGTTEENLTVDAGINNPSATLGSISNLVFFDVDGDGVQDAGEPGVAGVSVRLFNDGPDGIPGNDDDVFVRATTTDINGNYLFDGLVADNYTIYFSSYPSGFAGTLKDQGGDDNLDSDAPGTGKTDGITLTAGQDRTDVDFGIRSTTTAALGNFVWFDNDNDGVQDAGEPGIAGVTVLLYRPGVGPDGIAGNADDAQPVASAITDANGGYLFTNLVPGTYQVGFSNIPTGTTFTTQDQTAGGGNDTNDSDVNPSTGLTGNYVLAAGDVNFTVDAGVSRQTTATVGTTVWYDLGTVNGVREPGEPTPGGVTVSLINNLGVVVATGITGNDGNYLFTNVVPGTYTIQFGNLPPGTSYTTQNVGGVNGVDNNSNPNNAGVTNSFVVTAGGSDLTIDAGLIGTPLPADGLVLAANLNGELVTLNWKTTSEYNTRNFETERSSDNINFVKVGSSVAAAGNSTLEKTYNSTDDIKGVQNNGTFYYRVKLYDENGSFRYSNVATVRVKGSGIKVWPNPFTEVLQISVTSQAAGTVELKLNDVSGRTVLIQRNTVGRGINQLSITNIKNLPAGTYLLQVINAGDNTISTYKLSKE